MNRPSEPSPSYQPPAPRSLRDEIVAHQREWARRRGTCADERGYLPGIEANLFAPLSDAARAAFGRGSGREMTAHEGRHTKMCALHSSSALGVNVFDFWSGRDRAPLAEALRLNGRIVDLHFEAQLLTGARGIPPNLDVLLCMDDGRLVGIECKYTEWMTAKKHAAAMKDSYFDGNGSYWSRAGLSRSHELARDIRDGAVTFSHLDAPQLLKHALGLARAARAKGAGFELLYVYCDGRGTPQADHARELERFVSATGDELRFRAISYQALVAALRAVLTLEDERAYLAYLTERYCTGPAATV
jgi:hypothetical protein